MAFQIRLGTTQAIAKNGSGTEGTTMVTFPVASTYKTTSTTLVKNARNSKGELKVSIVRAGIRKVEVSWKAMTITDYAKLGTFFNNNFSFYAVYYDQDEGKYLCKYMYVGDRVADTLEQKVWTEGTATGITGQVLLPQYVKGVKLSLIEL